MKKKLLLTTALLSTISAATIANATDYTIVYNGNNNFTFDGAQYASLALLATEIKSREDAGTINVDNGNDNIDVDQASKAAFYTDIFAANNNGLKDNFVAITASELELDRALVATQFNQLANLVTSLPQEVRTQLFNTVDIFDLDPGELDELFKDLIYAKGDAAQVQSSVVLRERNNATQSKFTKLETQLSAENASLKAIIEEKNQLLKKLKLTPEESAKLDTILEKLSTITTLVDLRNSKETQENLKQRIASIQEALAKNDDTAKAKVIADLNVLKRSLDQYLVKNVKDATSVPDVQKSDSVVSEGLMNSLVISRGVVDSRIGGFSAVAAGDLMQTYGVWAQGSMSRGTQKAYGNAPGYKLDQKGVTIGADTGDETLLGLAYSFFMNDIKNKANSSSKEDVKSHIVTVYGKFDVTNEVFVSGQGQYGKSNIKKKRATGDLENNIASAKTNASSMAAKLEVGYDYEVAPQIHLVPTVGASYANIEVKGYKETGNGLNRSVAKRTTNRTSGLAGITAKYVADMGGSMKVIPEIHANVDYAFNTKNSATLVTIVNGIDAIATPSQKISKGFYNVGGSVKGIQADMYEISAGYDLGLAKKFQSHTGTLKLKVNL